MRTLNELYSLLLERMEIPSHSCICGYISVMKDDKTITSEEWAAVNENFASKYELAKESFGARLHADRYGFWWPTMNRQIRKEFITHLITIT